MSCRGNRIGPATRWPRAIRERSCRPCPGRSIVVASSCSTPLGWATGCQSSAKEKAVFDARVIGHQAHGEVCCRKVATLQDRAGEVRALQQAVRQATVMQSSPGECRLAEHGAWKIARVHDRPGKIRTHQRQLMTHAMGEL